MLPPSKSTLTPLCVDSARALWASFFFRLVPSSANQPINQPANKPTNRSKCYPHQNPVCIVIRTRTSSSIMLSTLSMACAFLPPLITSLPPGGEKQYTENNGRVACRAVNHPRSFSQSERHKYNSARKSTKNGHYVLARKLQHSNRVKKTGENNFKISNGSKFSGD